MAFGKQLNDIVQVESEKVETSAPLLFPFSALRLLG